jgi:hypothetical protein
MEYYIIRKHFLEINNNIHSFHLIHFHYLRSLIDIKF